jgi:hypothetical protein
MTSPKVIAILAAALALSGCTAIAPVIDSFLPSNPYAPSRCKAIDQLHDWDYATNTCVHVSREQFDADQASLQQANAATAAYHAWGRCAWVLGRAYDQACHDPVLQDQVFRHIYPGIDR